MMTSAQLLKPTGTALRARGWSALAVLACLVASGAALAENMADPTRPPAAWLAGQPSTPGAAAQALEASNAGASQILVVSKGRKFAIIDGQMVQVGDFYNGSRVVGVGAGGLVMQKEGHRETLSPTPSVNKKIRTNEPSAPPASSGRGAATGERK